MDWPVAADRPELIVLAARKDLRDSRTRALIDRQATAARAEDANLLYVALTRARQYLFVSGSARPGAANTGWYGLVETAMSDCEPDENGHPCIVSGSARQAGTETDAPHEPVVIEPGLSGPVTTALRDLPIAPSRQVSAGGYGYADDDGRERGIALHMMLDYLTRETATDHATLLHRIANRLQRDRQDAELGDWWQEARAVVGHPDLAPLFDAQRYRKAFNEVPVQYRSGQRMIYGVIDRLVVTDSAVLVIDYKSHRHADSDAIRHLVEDYRPQLECYATAAARLWPEREVTPCLLFTARHELVRLDALQSDPARP